MIQGHVQQLRLCLEQDAKSHLPHVRFDQGRATHADCRCCLHITGTGIGLEPVTGPQIM